MNYHREPPMILNWVRLTEGQAMAVRVAVSHFHMDLINGWAQELGEIGPLYEARLREVEEILLRPIEGDGPAGEKEAK